MPLLNRKQVPLTPTIPYDPKRKRKEVWYLRFTNEVFTNYESYINKLTLYHQAIWECEATGKKSLTYEQALESEKTERDRAEYKFCEALRKSILTRIQFQTGRLDALVNDVHTHFKNVFVVNEIVQCRLNEYDYIGRVLEIIPGQKRRRHGSNSEKSLKVQENEVDVPRQPNGRLRFPDAFLHPEPQLFTLSLSGSREETESEAFVFVNSFQYKIQLVNESHQPLEDCTRIVDEDNICRQKRVFTKFNIQAFIRECAYKGHFANSSWLLRPSVAYTYGIETSLSENFCQEQHSPEKTLKKCKMSLTKTSDEKEAEKRARKEETLLQKAKLKQERERLREEKKKQSAVKYPIEDLDLPIYRKDPNQNWLLMDMSPQKYSIKEGCVIPYPSGGRSERPIPHHNSSIPPELFDSFLSIWAFLTVFAEPLKLTAYNVDEFEQALFHTTHQPKSTVLVEYNACLLNVIINERKEDTPSEIINGNIMETYVESLEEKQAGIGGTEGSNDEEDQETEINKQKHSSELKSNKESDSPILPQVERGWRDKEHLRFSSKWDSKELRANYDHRGWETALIGCLNDIATPDLLPDVDCLLRHLVPKIGSSAADRERQYPILTVKQKLGILGFLVDAVNESNLIKNYMDYCQEQLSEFRKQKVELNKEVKALSLKRSEMDKREKAEKSVDESDEDNDSDDNSDESDDNSNEDGSENDSDSSDSRIARRERRHQSRQEKLKQWQRKREEQELKRRKQYAEQRQVAKAKSQELRQRANERKKLEEEEKLLKKKEDHLEKCIRRYMTLRIKPLGKDKFNNRYIYLDNVGVSNTYGSGRLYINSPTDGDIQTMMERDYRTNLSEQPWGYGGGCWFIKQLMLDQGLFEEKAWLENRMNELASGKPSKYKGWWKYYSDPEEIDKLLSWLNPKGIRENKLKNELLKQQGNIIESIKKKRMPWQKSNQHRSGLQE